MKAPTAVSLFALVIATLVGCEKHSAVPEGENGRDSAPRATQQQVQSMKEAIESLSHVKTRLLSVEQFAQIVQSRARTNLDALSESERKKLIVCLNGFYACYSTGDFAAFKRFRLHAPFLVSEALASAVTKAASEKGTPLKSDEDVLRFAWNRWNGSNRIGQVSEEHVLLSCVERGDLGTDLRYPSVGQYMGSGASCWEGAVVYQPAPAELLEKHGALRFFALELLVRFNPHKSGPASPLVLVGYWDPTREDWMPYALCTTFHVGTYDTIF